RPLSMSAIRPARHRSRRAVLQLSLGALVAMPLAVACGPASPTAPAAQPDARPTTAPAAPAAAPKPPPASGQAEAAKLAAGGQAEPKAPAFNKAKLDGKLSVVQSRDFHPDHNTFVEQKIR